MAQRPLTLPETLKLVPAPRGKSQSQLADAFLWFDARPGWAQRGAALKTKCATAHCAAEALLQQACALAQTELRRVQITIPPVTSPWAYLDAASTALLRPGAPVNLLMVEKYFPMPPGLRFSPWCGPALAALSREWGKSKRDSTTPAEVIQEALFRACKHLQHQNPTAPLRVYECLWAQLSWDLLITGDFTLAYALQLVPAPLNASPGVVERSFLVTKTQNRIVKSTDLVKTAKARFPRYASAIDSDVTAWKALLSNGVSVQKQTDTAFEKTVAEKFGRLLEQKWREASDF